MSGEAQKAQKSLFFYLFIFFPLFFFLYFFPLFFFHYFFSIFFPLRFPPPPSFGTNPVWREDIKYTYDKRLLVKHEGHSLTWISPGFSTGIFVLDCRALDVSSCSPGWIQVHFKQNRLTLTALLSFFPFSFSFLFFRKYRHWCWVIPPEA